MSDKKNIVVAVIFPFVFAIVGIALIYIVGTGKYVQYFSKLTHSGQQFTEADKTCTLPKSALARDRANDPQLFMSCSGFLE